MSCLAGSSKKQTIARALGLHVTPLTAQALAATGIVKVIIHDHSDDSSFKWGTLLVDHGNEDLVGSGNTALSVPVDKSCVIDEAVDDHKGLRSVQPLVKHGTTLACEGVCRQGTAINFSKHTEKAFNEAMVIEGDVKAMVIAGEKRSNYGWYQVVF
ncbi:hypothetical protein BDR04DRAFT_1115993 [Suillus decipiens]|nr:hypothetical protein BDR04DRAFT_1115993 [Suillus decipiens]